MTTTALRHPTPLTASEKALQGFTHQMIVTYLDANPQATAATALTVILAALAVGMTIKSICWELITAFADSRDTGNNTTTLLLQHGSTQLIAATEANLNGSTVVRARSDTAATIAAAENLQLVFGAPASGKTLSALTQGEVHIFFNLEQPSRLG